MPKKILTIDDDPYIVKYITEVLSDNGYATCSASSVEEAFPSSKRKGPISSRWTHGNARRMGSALLPQDVHEPRIQGHARHRDQRSPGHPPRHPATPWPPSRSPSIPKSCSSIVNRVLESKDAARKAMDGE